MATGVLFGQPRTTIVAPGAYSLVDASALNIAPPFSFNVVCCIGPALGGIPLTPYLFNDASQAQKLFGAGTPLAEAIRFAFQGGANGGASAVIGIRNDNCGQATGTLAAANGGAGLSATFDDFGAYGNTFSVSFFPGSVSGTMAMVQGTTLDGSTFTQKFDNATSFSQLVSRINNESPITLRIDSGGSFASQTLTLATSQTDGRATLTGQQGTVWTNQAYIYQYPASMVANSTDSMLVSFNGSTSFAIASIDTNTDVITTSLTHPFTAGVTLTMAGDTLPTGVSSADAFVVRTAPTGTTLTVARVLATQDIFAVSTVNTSTEVVTAPGHTLVNGDVVQLSGTAIGNLVAGRNYFVVGVSGDNLQVSSTLSGSPLDLTGTFTAVSVRRIAAASTAFDLAGSVSNARLIRTPGLSQISASTPADFNGFRQAARVIDTYTQATTNASITASAYGSDTARITLGGVETWGHISRQALPGSIFTIASGTYQGTYQVLHFEWSGLSADKVRVVRKLSGDRRIAAGTYTGNLVWYPSILYPRVQPATTALETQTPANGLLATGGQYLTVTVRDKATYYNTMPGDTIESVVQAIVNQINLDPDFPAIAAASYNAGTFTGTITLSAKEAGTVPNSYRVGILVNAQTTLLVSAGGTLMAGGVEPVAPRNALGVTTGSIILSGGFDSIPTMQRWVDALEVIKAFSVRWVICTTDNVGVQMLLADHCTLMSSTPQRRERVCVLGHGLGWTNDQIRARAEIFQSERVIFVSPGFTSSDPLTGLPKQYPAFYMAAVVAGMLAAEGNGVSDPITKTYARNVISLEKTYSQGTVELDQMINSGVLTIERDPSLTRVSRGYRVTRAITTWRVTVNSALKSNAFESISVVNQSDFIAAVIREGGEALFIGTAIFPETLENIRLWVNSELRRRSGERYIYGFDPKFTQVSLSPDSPNAVSVSYKVFPAPALEFILNTQLLAPIPVA